jgi:NADH:ubiquinone oxidoreductase subunit F (NADH-binding)
MSRMLQRDLAHRGPATPDPGGGPRLLAGWYDEQAPAWMSSHVARYGDLPRLDRGRGEAFADELEASGLAGRGGAGFPTHRKLRAVLAGSRRPIVVANGMEGEPASAKDRLLLSVAPHLVLDGAVLVANAVGADEIHLCIARGARSTAQVLERALDERRVLGRDGVKIRVWSPPARYVAGEETAVVSWLNGGPAKPTMTPPRPFERGVGGRPTVLQNVETLAHVALIARFGAAWFRRAGTTAEPGSMLLSVSRPDERIAVFETPLGTPVVQALAACRLAERPQAVLIGGYFGSWFAYADAERMPLTQADLRVAGGALGAGMLAVLPPEACGLCETARVARYLAGESARQCGPCNHGLRAVARDLALLCHGRDPSARSRALERMQVIQGRGACRHPDGVIRLVRSMLDVFAEHVGWHERHGPCAGMYRTPLLPVGTLADGEEEWR